MPEALGGGGPRVETRGFGFELIGADVEQLNRGLISGDLGYDLCAISAAAYPRVADRYRITACGGSFGEGYGPKLVCREPVDTPEALRRLAGGASLAVPGTNTTAFSVLRAACARWDLSPQVVPFLDIPAGVASGAYEFGLLIHEAQLTFHEHDLSLALDLGAWWASAFGGPLPLGLNVVRRDLDDRFGGGSVVAISAALEDSIDYATSHADDSQRYLLQVNPARTEWRDRALLDRYLSMYVSDLTRDMGEAGRRGLETLYRVMAEGGAIDEAPVVDCVSGRG